MSLYPGAPRWDDEEKKWILDKEALENSMAMAMENAMKDVYKKIKGNVLPELGKDDRRLLFVAIAQGVVKHLKDQEEAFQVHEVNVTQEDDNRMTSSGTISFGIINYPVSVTQDENEENKVKSQGNGKLQIDTKGVFET